MSGATLRRDRVRFAAPAVVAAALLVAFSALLVAAHPAGISGVRDVGKNVPVVAGLIAWLILVLLTIFFWALVLFMGAVDPAADAWRDHQARKEASKSHQPVPADPGPMPMTRQNIYNSILDPHHTRH